MNYSFSVKGISLTQDLKDRAINKLSRLERIIPENSEAHVNFTLIKNDHRVEVTIPLRKRILRAEVNAPDFMSAIDKSVDILDSQISRLKGRLKNKSRKDVSFKEEFNDIFKDFESFKDNEEDNGIIIKRSKKFALKPMDADEAVMNMELIGHTFFVFRNSQTDEVNVIYKRKDGAYGLIEPEY